MDTCKRMWSENQIGEIAKENAAGITGVQIEYLGGVIEDGVVARLDFSNNYQQPYVIVSPTAPDPTPFLEVPAPVTKTLFGSKSILGTGNIDLYRHQLTFTTANNVNASKKGYAVIYSSKKTQIKSLANLETILGNTFVLPVYGQYVTLDGGDNEHFYDFCFVTESKIYVRSYYNTAGVSPDEQERIITDVANVTWSNINITDTVTAI